jgi:hypothetical protein
MSDDDYSDAVLRERIAFYVVAYDDEYTKVRQICGGRDPTGTSYFMGKANVPSGVVPLVEHPLPPAMEGWRHWTLDLTQEERDRAGVDYTLTVEKELICLIPDFWCNGSWTQPIVSTKVREVIEVTAPGAAQFFPVRVMDTTGGHRWEVERYALWARHLLDAQGETLKRPDANFASSNMHINPFWRGLSENREVAAFCENFGLFGHLRLLRSIVFTTSVFQALRDAGVTGLDERPLDWRQGRNNKSEVIGHVFRR